MRVSKRQRLDARLEHTAILLTRLEQGLSEIQILTVLDLPGGKNIQLPPNIGTCKQAANICSKTSDQGALGFEVGEDGN